jgi:hypothetical protein
MAEVTSRSSGSSDPEGTPDVEDNFRKTVGQLIGGGAVLIGAGFAFFQFLDQHD